MVNHKLYVILPADTKLIIYKTKGVLISSTKKTEIKRNIALTIYNCLCGQPLNKSIEKAINNNSEKPIDVLLGILALIKDNELLLTNMAINDPKAVINKENVFYPQGIHVELTKSCNLKCYYCYKKAIFSKNKQLLETSKLLDILRLLAGKGLKVVELTGGEPLLHPDFLIILKTCYNLFEKVAILTNGTLIDEHLINSIKNYKDKLVFSISLDSYDEVEFEKKSGIKGSFKQATKGIKLLTKENFFVRASMAVDEYNWHHIEKTLLYAKSLGVSGFTYSPIMPSGRADKKRVFWETFPIKTLVSFEKYIIEKYPAFIHILEGQSVKELQLPGGCGAGSRTFVLSEDGLVRMCATSEHYGLIGDLKTQSIDDVFSHPFCRIVSDLILPNKSSCSNCKRLPLCAGCPLKVLEQIKKIGRDNCYWLKNNIIAQRWYDMVGLESNNNL